MATASKLFVHDNFWCAELTVETYNVPPPSPFCFGISYYDVDMHHIGNQSAWMGIRIDSVQHVAKVYVALDVSFAIDRRGNSKANRKNIMPWGGRMWRNVHRQHYGQCN